MVFYQQEEDAIRPAGGWGWGLTSQKTKQNKNCQCFKWTLNAPRNRNQRTKAAMRPSGTPQEVALRGGVCMCVGGPCSELSRLCLIGSFSSFLVLLSSLLLLYYFFFLSEELLGRWFSFLCSVRAEQPAVHGGLTPLHFPLLARQQQSNVQKQQNVKTKQSQSQQPSKQGCRPPLWSPVSPEKVPHLKLGNQWTDFWTFKMSLQNSLCSVKYCQNITNEVKVHDFCLRWSLKVF